MGKKWHFFLMILVLISTSSWILSQSSSFKSIDKIAEAEEIKDLFSGVPEQASSGLLGVQGRIGSLGAMMRLARDHPATRTYPAGLLSLKI